MQKSMGGDQISVADFETLREQTNPYALLDVREAWEVALCGLPEAIIIPMSQIPQKLELLPHDRPLVVMCHHGQRSYQVMGWLRQQGFDNAINLDGGIDEWARSVDRNMATY